MMALSAEDRDWLGSVAESSPRPLIGRGAASDRLGSPEPGDPGAPSQAHRVVSRWGSRTRARRPPLAGACHGAIAVPDYLDGYGDWGYFTNDLSGACGYARWPLLRMTPHRKPMPHRSPLLQARGEQSIQNDLVKHENVYTHLEEHHRASGYVSGNLLAYTAEIHDSIQSLIENAGI